MTITKQRWETEAHRARVETLVGRKAERRREKAAEDAVVAELRSAMDRQDWMTVVATFNAYAVTNASEAS